MRVTVHLSHSQLVVLSYSLFYIKIGIYGQWKCKSTVTGEVVSGGGWGGGTNLKRGSRGVKIFNLNQLARSFSEEHQILMIRVKAAENKVEAGNGRNHKKDGRVSVATLET